jgi:ABC-2 type transport system ATP-binding protein
MAAVEAEGLVKVYRSRKSEVRALDGVDLEVREGTVLGLLGPNGAGKTTTVRILATLLKPNAGSARVAGFDLLREPQSVRKAIGLSGQYAAVDENLTGRENLWMFGRLYHLSSPEARVRADELLERFQLDEAADRVAKTYSGGMRRRLDLAASLMAHPPVLFLDEPTTGLDPTSRLRMWDVIRGLVADGTTVLLTTQYLDEADQLADRIAVIDYGRLVTEGTADELKDRTGGAVVELDLPVAQRQTALGVLQPLAPRHDLDRDRIVLPAPDGALTLRHALRLLEDAGIAPTDVALHRPTLDDVFLTLTGHNRRELTGGSA